MICQSEKISDSLEEAKPLLQKHWDEIAFYKDIPLSPDYDLYLKLESAGVVKSFAARNGDGKMIGYAVYLLQKNPHYKESLWAKQDIIFVDPDHRGMGMFFLRWCDEQLKELGVQVVGQHVTKSHNFGPA